MCGEKIQNLFFFKNIYMYIYRLTDQYLGCYEDREARILESTKILDKQNTIKTCITMCKLMGMKYAGMEVRTLLHQ